jgi:hypothetical protein
VRLRAIGCERAHILIHAGGAEGELAGAVVREDGHEANLAGVGRVPEKGGEAFAIFGALEHTITEVGGAKVRNPVERNRLGIVEEAGGGGHHEPPRV